MDANGMERLEQELRRLKLRRVREVLDDYNRLAVSQQLSHLDFLAGLMHEEVTARDTTQQHKRLAAAGFPVLKTVEGFDFGFQTSIHRQEIMELARLRFVDEHSNVCLVGPPGVGKSHLAIALGYKAVLAGRTVRFTTAQDLVEDLYASLADGSLRAQMRALRRLDVLVIDELGFLTLDTTASNHFFQVVAQAYEQRSLIVTSNRPYQEWGSIFASTAIATAVLDRLLHHVTTLNLRGDSYRLKGGMAQLPSAEPHVPVSPQGREENARRDRSPVLHLVAAAPRPGGPSPLLRTPDLVQSRAAPPRAQALPGRTDQLAQPRTRPSRCCLRAALGRRGCGLPVAPFPGRDSGAPPLGGHPGRPNQRCRHRACGS